MTTKANRLRSANEVRESIDEYLFDNPTATLRDSKWLQQLACELADAMKRESNETNH